MPLAEVGWSLFGKLLEKLAEDIMNSKVKRNNTASEYFKQLAASMESVVVSLRKNEIPYISGNEMNTLIHAFDVKTNKIFKKDDPMPYKEVLEEAAKAAKQLDAYVLENRLADDSANEERLIELERIVGTCRGLAGILHSPA